MKRVDSQLVVMSLMFGLTLHSQIPQQPHPLRRHWTETETETVWTVRYTNCDYAYFVLLGKGAIGHDTLPPSPNHGFLVSLPDVGKKSSASAYTEERYVWVDASYDVIDDQSLPGAVSNNEQIMEGVRGKPGVIKNTPTKLAGLQAVLSKVEYTTPRGTVVGETIIAVRSGIVYTIGLRTFLENLAADEERFQEVTNGFKLLKLPRGECSNG